jgi:hypothetical protein
MSQQFFERLTSVITAPPASEPQQALPIGVGVPPSPPLAVAGAAPDVSETTGWSGTVTITMPGWAWAFTLAAALAAGWLATH